MTTKFLVLLYLPLIPLASFRVRDLTSDAGARTRCQSAVAPEPVGLDWRQALCGAAVVVTTLIAIVAWSRLAS